MAVRIALHVADPTLRARISRACAEAHAELVGAMDADVVLADAPPDTTAPVIALMPSGEPGEASRVIAGRIKSSATGVPGPVLDRLRIWPCDVRAAVPAELDAATLGAVITVVAAGLDVKPHGWTADGVGAPGTATRSRSRPGDWAEGHEPDTADAVAELKEIPPLTPREREVLALLAQGASNKTIARALSVSVHTAKFHVASVTEKLGASGRLEAVAIAIRSGLVMI